MTNHLKISKELLYTEYIINNKSVQEIADQLHINHKTVRRRFIEYGIPIRKYTYSDSYLNRKKNTGHNRKHNCWRGFKGIGSSFLSTNFLEGAKRRGLDISISLEDIWWLYKKQKQKCFLSGQRIFFQQPGLRCSQTVSIDRIDSNKGYSLENIQLVHKDINKMKWKHSNLDFIWWCKAIQSYQVKQEILPYSYCWDNNDPNINKNPYELFFSRLKSQAKYDKRPINLTIDDIKFKYKEQNKRCALTGLKIFFRRNWSGYQTVSLDRIDSNYGYIKGNIQFVHRVVNCMKLDYNLDYFLKTVKRVVKWNTHQSN